MALITVSGLTKFYGSRQVLHGIDLKVDEGEILGVLGPNGSGKTTAVECIGGLRDRDGGSVSVAGMDPATDPLALREMLGMQLQQCRLPNKMRVAEALDLYSAFYADPRPAGELLERFGLSAHAHQPFGKLSGGQQQRLSIALALIGRPRIAFLDELTTGLDPAARREIWEYLRLLRDDGVTMLLVTHFMEEAAYLCDRVAILEGGRIVASGTPDAIATATGGQETSFAADDAIDPDTLRRLPGVASVDLDRGRVVVRGDADSPQVVLAALASNGVTARQLRVTAPSLDDAYLSLTASAPTSTTQEGSLR